mgnify:CR=1 FL=1
MENNNKKYFVTRYKNFAITLSFLLGEDFMRFDDKREEGKKIYSFKNSDKLQNMVSKIDESKYDK